MRNPAKVGLLLQKIIHDRNNEKNYDNPKKSHARQRYCSTAAQLYENLIVIEQTCKVNNTQGHSRSSKMAAR